MKGIVGRKLGMTQLFDPESGVVTPVTVIEAGPCPVVQVKTKDNDGYDAVQLAFDPVADWKLTLPEFGHLKRFGVGPHRCLGSHLARLEARTMLQVLFEKAPEYQLVEEGVELADDIGTIAGFGRVQVKF